ncbi:GerAB/ArcD/ProY family transporter [Bacillus sp. SD088]|uniref:GerAB/ArcD/ProY family transporter n=1 Tax=Bacillus sp. SD088 TaxID=2782012 RepID=UPI001A95985B|nr:endospore germination permease [Bacillus sp. SD088]MBO0993536.1 endospore germination permease [Bacillus sp. SD088]
MKYGAISVIHVILLSMTFIGLKNHVTILPSLLSRAGRDGWISVLFATLLILICVFLLLYTHKKTEQKEIKQWLDEKLGKVWSTIFHIIIALFLMLLAAFTMRETLQWINATFLIETPIWSLLIIYMVLCIMLALSSLRTILILNALVLFGVVVFGFFVAMVNIQVKDYTLILPILENGFQPVLKGMVYPASGMIEVVFFLFLQHKIKGRIRFIHYLIIIGIIMGLTLGPLVGAITEFGPDEAVKQLYPAYEEWGIVSIGRFIEHLDFLSIYQWLTGAFIRVGLLLYFVIHLSNFHKKQKKIWFLMTPVFLIICLLLLNIEDHTFIKLQEHYFLPLTFVILLIVSLFYALVAFITTRNRRTET